MRRQPPIVPLSIAAAVAVASLVVGWAALAGRPAAAVPAPPPAAVSTFDAAPGVNLRRTVTVQVVQQTKGAVVNISAKKLVAEHVRFNELWPSFDTGQTVQVPANSLGSGFVVHRDGYVVTNNHVIDHARQISVELADGRTLAADVVGADPDADLAVLHVRSATPLPTLSMGDSSDLLIGEPTIAVGNPMGLSHSVSTGIVSALHRDIVPTASAQGQPPAPVHGEDAALHDLIQTDAAINPGNSGGPLLNAYGQVIGINTAVRSGAQNIGFAIPINRLRDLIPELMNPSQVNKVDVPLHLAERRTVGEPATVMVEVVATGTGAAPSVVASIGGRPPADIVDAYAALLDARAGRAVAITYADGHQQQVTPRATPLPDAVVQARRRFGLTIVPMTPVLADRYRMAQEDGLLVTGVDRGTAAAAAKLQPGDVVVQFGPVHLSTLDDLGALIARLPDTGGAARVFYIRGGQLWFTTMRI